MVRVAIDSGPLHGHRTGIGNGVAWFLDELDASAHLHDVEVTRYLTSARATLRPGERRLPLPAAAALRLWARTSMPRLDRALGRPDVVHGTNYVVPPTDAPRLVSVYDCWFLDHPDDVHRDVALAARAMLRAIRDGATVLASSHATAERLAAHVETDRIQVVHLGPPPSVVDDALGPADEAVAARLGGRPFVVSLGTIERRKNVPTIVRAFARLAADVPEIHLIVAGADGDDMIGVQRALDRLDPVIRDRIVLAGRVSSATKEWLLREARVLAYPSLDEGFGFPLLEAQQHGLPVAASTAGSIPEVAGSGALYSSPDDVDALAANLFGLLTGSRRDAVIEAGRRNLERFSCRTCVADTAQLYHHLARR